MELKRALMILLLASATAGIAAADTTRLAGNWMLHYNISGYEGDLDCTFSQNDADLTGACKGEQGSVSVTGKVNENAVTLAYKAEYNGDELTVTYTGKLETPTKMAGTVSVQPVGADGDFTATRPE